MRKLSLVVILMALALVAPMTGHALTTIASCTVTSANFGVTPGCGVSFTCPPHTINLRAVPANFQFTGVVDIYFTDGTQVVTQTTEWVSGRIQIDGPDFTTVLPTAGASCYLGVDTSEGSVPAPIAGGSARGVAEA